MAFNINVQLVDAYGRTTNRRFENDRATIADALTDAGTLITALEAVSLAAVVKHNIERVTAVGHSASEGANVDTGATIHTVLADGTGYALKYPAPDPAMINADGSVDLADEAIIAYIAQFKSGGHFTVSDGELIASVRYGELDR